MRERKIRGRLVSSFFFFESVKVRKRVVPSKSVLSAVEITFVLECIWSSMFVEVVEVDDVVVIVVVMVAGTFSLPVLSVTPCRFMETICL
jgi:hypothetical protein